MRLRLSNVAYVAALICVFGFLGCGGKSPAAPGSSGSLSITGETILTSLGQTTPLGATHLVNGLARSVTTESLWSSSSTLVVAVSQQGVVTAQSVGSADVTATYNGTSATLHIVVATAEDCGSYDWPNLTILSFTASDGLPAYVLAAPFQGGLQLLVSVDTRTDAENALALGRRHTALCFVGRNNRRPNRQAYILSYWSGSTGETTTISPEDCRSYGAGALTLSNRGAEGWAVMDGTSVLRLLDNEPEAGRALAVARQFSSLCHIGRQNSRSQPLSFQTTYFK